MNDVHLVLSQRSAGILGNTKTPVGVRQVTALLLAARVRSLYILSFVDVKTQLINLISDQNVPTVYLTEIQPTRS